MPFSEYTMVAVDEPGHPMDGKLIVYPPKESDQRLADVGGTVLIEKDERIPDGTYRIDGKNVPQGPREANLLGAYADAVAYYNAPAGKSPRTVGSKARARFKASDASDPADTSDYDAPPADGSEPPGDGDGDNG